jgi:hypothetical protein
LTAKNLCSFRTGPKQFYRPFFARRRTESGEIP